jgi:hypothetical protein
MGDPMTKESMQNHIKHLEDKHKELKLDLMEADARGDELHAQKIKKEKLRLKDQLESCRKQLQSL